MSQTQRGYTEQIVFKDGEFKIERYYGNPKSPVKTYEYLPIETWDFVKHVDSSVLIIRTVENVEDIDQPQTALFYEMPLTFDVVDTPISKYVFLKTEKIRKIIAESLKTYEEYTMVYIRNLESSQTIMSQPDNTEGFPFSVIKVTRGKAKKITKEEADELVRSGKLYGIFADKDLTKRIV